MDIPDFEEIFRQIKINFWLIGIPFNQSRTTRRYFFQLLILIIIVTEEMAFFFSKLSVKNLLELTQLAPCTCIGLLSILKVVFIAIEKNNVYELSACLKLLYEDMLNDTKKRDLVKNNFLFLKYLVKYFFILNVILIGVYNFSTLILISYNYFTKDVIIYSLPYAVLLPFSTNIWYTWLFEYLHLVLCGFICVLYFTTVDALYYIMTSHICCQFTILCNEIKFLEANTSHCLRDIIKKHQYILKKHLNEIGVVCIMCNRNKWFRYAIRLSQDLEKIFRAPNLFNVLVGSLEICALGFTLTMGAWEQIPGVVLFLLSVLVQILMMSVCGENLIRESRRIGEAAFMCKWYNMDQKSKKTILLLMLRANKPQKLTAYKFSVISYESFTKIISTSWSYFIILKTLYTPPENNFE